MSVYVRDSLLLRLVLLVYYSSSINKVPYLTLVRCKITIQLCHYVPSHVVLFRDQDRASLQFSDIIVMSFLSMCRTGDS